MSIRISLRAAYAAIPVAAAFACATPALAGDVTSAPESVAFHGQATLVVQAVGGFASPYAGDNSLAPNQTKETLDLTAYLGIRPWSGAELWVNPEVDQGFGLSNTLGAAGFPSGEAYKVGKSSPYVRLQRLFLRQTINLGGGSEAVAGAANQLAGAQNRNRLVLTFGKFGVGDVFDTNHYAHDPRGDFLNWSVIDTGSFDYAADAWGYSYGISAEWYQANWTLRAGLFNLSKVPNGEVLEQDFSQNMLVGEIEHRHSIAGHAGAIRLTGFRNRGQFARLDEVLAAGRLDLESFRRPMSRAGMAINVEQEITSSLGLFLRAGVSDGTIETYDFTDIDRTVAFGGSLSGQSWGRSADTLAIALVDNGISSARQRFLSAGGLGVLIGDGQLPHPGDEQIVEAYYAWRPHPTLAVTFDYQHIANPGYNRDRGPVNVFGLRLHAAI